MVGGLVFFWGTFLSWRGRQYAAKANAEKILHSKPDVLYLRAFRSDISTVKGVFGGVLFGLREAGSATQEEQLADVLRPIGDFVAIGQPGEELPTPALRAFMLPTRNGKKSSKLRCG